MAFGHSRELLTVIIVIDLKYILANAYCVMELSQDGGQRFPRTIAELQQLVQCGDDVSYLSVVLGHIEDICIDKIPKPVPPDPFAEADADLVSSLHARFVAMIRGVPIEGLSRHACIRAIAATIAKFTANYSNDRLHQQTLFSLMRKKQIDCFGSAVAVWCGCKIAGVPGVHLVLSEDHR